MPRNTCMKCGADVRFAHGALSEAKVILDAEPDAERGNVYIIDFGTGRGKALTLGGPLLEAARKEGLPLHLSHYASCPYAADFRKGGRAR